MKQSIAHFIHLQKLKQLLMTGLSVMDLNQSILRLHQTYKNLLERFQIGFSSLSIYYYFKMLKDFKTLNWKQLYQTVERTKPSKKKNVWLIFKILMIMNALNGVWSDTYNLADHNQVKIREVKHLKKNCNLTLKMLRGSSWLFLWIFQNCIF